MFEVRTTAGEVVAQRETVVRAERFCLFAAGSYPDGLEIAKDGTVVVRVDSFEVEPAA